MTLVLRTFKVVIFFSLIASLIGCSDRDLIDHASRKGKKVDKSVSSDSFSKIINAGKLRVVTRYSAVTYYIGPDGKRGFEYDLVSAFADAYGLEVEIILKDSIPQVLKAVEDGEADLAAAGISRKEAKDEKYSFGPAYQKVRQEVICHRDDVMPTTVLDLSNHNFVVASGSSYADKLSELKASTPELRWLEQEYTAEQLLEMVADKEIECTVAYSNIFETNRRYLPELQVAMALTEEQELAWVIRKNAKKLSEALIYWMNHYVEDGNLHHLEDQYYGHYTIFDYVNIRVFHRRIQSRLPKFRKLFEMAESEYGIPWTTLAAQSYQESYWDPKAKSPTGVRGLMMLTIATARSMGYKSRISAENSIFGGARYLSKLIVQVSPNVQGQDRLWFALAAYNVGMGHVHDAQTLAYSLGKNPNLWTDVREVLPLLSQKKYYKKSKYGYARGMEPVRYVQRIREFKDILDLQSSVELEKLLLQEVDVEL